MQKFLPHAIVNLMLSTGILRPSNPVRRFKYIAGCLLLSLLTSNAQAQFTNGNFSAGPAGCNAGTGWTTQSGFMSAQHTTTFYPGNYWIDLTPCNDWGNGTWIEQAVPTTIGNCYRVEFDIATYCGWDRSDAGVYFSVNGSVLGPRIFNDTFTCTNPPMNWKRRSTLVFTATTNPSVLRLTGEGRCTSGSPTTGFYACNPLGGPGNPGVIGIDNVVLIPVSVGSDPVNLGNDTTICYGVPFVLDAGNPTLPHLWSTGATTQTITIDTGGVYWCSVVGPCGITADTINIDVYQVPVVSLGNDTGFCNVIAAPLDAGNPGCSYLWSNGATTQTITATSEGAYWCQVSTPCDTITDTIHIVRSPDPVPVTTGGFSCPGKAEGVAKVVPFAGDTTTLSYTWTNDVGNILQVHQTNNGDSLTSLLPGLYHVYMSTKWGCDTTADIVIAPHPVPDAVFEMDTVVCTGETVQFTNTSAGTIESYSWDFGDNRQSALSDPTHIYTETGIYPVTLIAYGTFCEDTVVQNIRVTDFNSLVLYASDNIVDQKDVVVLTTGAQEPYTVLRWTPAYLFGMQTAASQTLIVDTARRYVVTAESQYGCLDSAYVDVAVNSIVFIPDGFSPNGDGRNDYFHPIVWAGPIKTILFQVYNRWGNMVYTNESNNPRGWDGSYKGEPAEIGTYFYNAVIETVSGKVIYRKGDVTLIR